MTDIQRRARDILDQLVAISFEECTEIDRNFQKLPRSPGIYAIRQRTGGDPALLLAVEGILLRATEPPYNVKIPLQP